MPEISEIRRPGDDSDSSDDNGGVSESLGPSPDSENWETLYSKRQNQLREDIDFSSIFSLLAQYDVPFVDLPFMQGVSGRSYGLGTGVSSMVSRHETGSGTTSIYPKGRSLHGLGVRRMVKPSQVQWLP